MTAPATPPPPDELGRDAVPDVPPRPVELRIGNVEREATVSRLQAALNEGRLDIGEFDERVAATYAARTTGELVPITADLPTQTPTSAAMAPPVSRPRSPAPQRHTPEWLVWAWRVWAIAVSINLVIWLLVSLSEDDPQYFWPMWVAGPWGAVLLVNTLFANWNRSQD